MKPSAPTELGTRSVGLLLWQYALPAIIAMTAASLYNNVDRIFIGHIAPDGGWGVSDGLPISGLAVTFPFMNLAIAFGAMVGVGASTVISVRLGQKDYRTAQQVLGNTVVLNVIFGLLFTGLSLLYLDPILRLFGASDATLPYASEYMRIILLGNIISHSYFGLNAVLRSAGHPRLAMYCTILTVVINSILDPILIFGLRLGIQGAAIATVLAQAVALAWQFRILSRPSEVVRLQRGIYGLRLRIIRQIIAVGMSPFLINACACLVVLLINRGMLTHGGDLAIGAYGIVNSIIFFFLMMVMGFNQGMQPIVGYNWGARQNERVWQCLRYTMLCATGVTTLGFLAGELIPEQLTHIFTGDPQITALASRGFRITVSIFPLVGAQMVIGNFFQSIGHAGKSIFLSLTRQLLFLIPGLILLPLHYGLDGVWMAIPVADSASVITAAAMLWWLVRHVEHETHRPA